MDESLPKASPYTEKLRDRLVAVTLEWERVFGVVPSITSAVSEYDAACLVGHTDEGYGKACAGRTAVTRGCVSFSTGFGIRLRRIVRAVSPAHSLPLSSRQVITNGIV